MKVVFDLSVTSAEPPVPWDAAWVSPVSGTAPGLVLDYVADVFGTDRYQGSLGSTLAFSRGSAATRTDAVGALDTVAVDVARIDHDPVTFAPQGLLLEAARTNLITDSDTPAGQTNTVAAVEHILSFYGTGTVTLSGVHAGSLVGSASYPTRSTLVFTPSAGSLTLVFSGDVVAPQLEQGSIASSYVPSGSSATQRDNDVADVTLGSWFSASEGTLVFSGSLDHAASNDRIVEIDGGAASTRLSILWNTVLDKPQFQVWDGGVLQVAIAPPGNAISMGEHFRVAIAYAANDFVISLNGSAMASDTSGTMPSGLTTLRFGRSSGGAQGLMVAEALSYYPARLSDAEVQSLST